MGLRLGQGFRMRFRVKFNVRDGLRLKVRDMVIRLRLGRRKGLGLE